MYDTPSLYTLKTDSTRYDDYVHVGTCKSEGEEHECGEPAKQALQRDL